MLAMGQEIVSLVCERVKVVNEMLSLLFVVSQGAQLLHARDTQSRNVSVHVRMDQ